MSNAGNEGLQVLVVVETQKVKSFLFASPYLRETRGASVLLDRLNRVETGKFFEGLKCQKKLIYLGGGSGRLLFGDEEEAGKFADHLRHVYRRETVTARVSVEVLDRDYKDGSLESIPDWISRGVAEARKNKLARVAGMPLVGGRWAQPCSSCGQETAEAMWTEFGEHRLCRGCFIKRQEVNQLYRRVKPGEPKTRVLKPTDELSKTYGPDFVFTTLSQYVDSRYRLRLPQDFGDIGQASRPANYLGFIYADGNDMGEMVKRIGREFPQDPDAIKAYAAFSKIVDRATREAAVEAVLEYIPRIPVSDDIHFLPAEFLMAGGDDLMLAVPAHNVMDVAVRFIKKYQQKTKGFQEECYRQGKLSKCFAKNGLAISAGVVIAHVHYPAHDLMRLAGELIKLAKAKAAKISREDREAKAAEISKEDREKFVGTLDFMVLHEAGTESLKDRRKKEYSINGTGKETIILTERPYTIDEAEWLLKTIRELKGSGASRSKLKALYGALFQNRLQAQFDALRLMERLHTTGDPVQRKPLFDLMGELERFPFRSGKWITPMTELIELYDFIHEGPEKEISQEMLPKKEVACD